MMRLLAIAMLLVLSSCGGKKKTDWGVTLGADEIRPYGAKLASLGLKHWFPEARIEYLSSGFRYDDLNRKLGSDRSEKSLLILEGLRFELSDPEWLALRRWASYGNEVIIFASVWDEKVLDELGLLQTFQQVYEETPLSKHNRAELRNQAVWVEPDSLRRFTHPGRSLLGHFQSRSNYAPDTTDAYVFGFPHTIGSGTAGSNCIRYPIGEGGITLHAAPLVLSNYFLLQRNNRHYLDRLWAALTPDKIATVYWQNYYKRSSEGGGWNVLWRYPATRWAILLALLAALLYVLFESKRRQRIIPIVKPPENSSVLFVETVGRLYHSKGNHENLAEKMVQHFLETVRSRYRLSTEILDEAFIKSLTHKAGVAEERAREAARLSNAIRANAMIVTETDLYHLHQTLQPFLN
jgi:hypothetical protein